MKHNTALYRSLQKAISDQSRKTKDNLDWLYAQLHPFFFVTMKDEFDTIVSLAMNLQNVSSQRQITLLDQEKKLVVARLNTHGSLYETLKTLKEREISYAELTHSHDPIPGADKSLEIHRYEFNRKTNEEIDTADIPKIPQGTKRAVSAAVRQMYPEFDFRWFDKDLGLLFLNNASYVRISPPERIARVLWLYQQGRSNDGLFMDVEKTRDMAGRIEFRILFSVGNPEETGFMTQVSEVFQRLGIGVQRSYSLNINTGINGYFLGTFYVTLYDGGSIEKDSDFFRELQSELYNTQILSTSRSTYTKFVAERIMTGEEASLTNALVAFCHTSLAHNQPDRFDLEAVKGAFISDPEMTHKLLNLFKAKFDPDKETGLKAYESILEKAEQAVESYNTGHRYLDEIRKTIFYTCIIFVRHILKTNFFVPEKHALAFRLDPAYLSELGPDFTSDLPTDRPFRVTFFFGRHGMGYHIGFSDIARGGWRTIICTTHDEFTTNTNTLFREVYVLAHTQHLKNKDIYEGGSKLTVVLDAEGVDSKDSITQGLYKLQYSFINAFLDIFTTEGGIAKNPRVVDYYAEDEPIELGPDENMHDAMIEMIANLSVKRGYLLGIGIMSSKHVGINHKEYGVTSRGVVKFAEIAMREIGIDIYRDSFSVKITGGPNGDVAGNAMKLLAERCPRVQIKSIVAGAGALYDPQGADLNELGKLILKGDIVQFSPEALHTGGFILFRRKPRQDGLRELYRKIIRTDTAVEEQWITTDEFHREFDNLIFEVPVDLFLPCGGRPETIDMGNSNKLFDSDENPSARVISEGANSFLTPEAREEIQKRGVVVLRDASANKCGVISSSYEIIANLLMTEKEFLKNKNAYVEDVLKILEKRAEQEANLIFKRHLEKNGEVFYTEISSSISKEINDQYARLFEFFQEQPLLADLPLYRKVILKHLPEFVSAKPKYRARVKDLPPKIKYAILASEIASTIVYEGGWEVDFEARLKGFLKKHIS
ncbi:MAG: amino acid dehydrogenase [Desulfobacterales bacterium]|nr:amino acid dehydrogenase [Desulfobacterales bacterium]